MSREDENSVLAALIGERFVLITFPPVDPAKDGDAQELVRLRTSGDLDVQLVIDALVLALDSLGGSADTWVQPTSERENGNEV